MKITRYVCAFAFVAAAHAQAGPPAFSARYDITRLNTKVGEMQVTLDREGELMRYQTHNRPVGMFSPFLKDEAFDENALLKEVNGQLLPVEYERRQEDRNERYKFDRAAGAVTGKYRKRKADMAVPADTTDGLSLTLKLMRDAASKGTSFTYPVMYKGKLRTYEYVRLEPQTISTAHGELETEVMERRKGDDEDTTYTIWFASEMNYLPVRYVNSKGGDTVYTVDLASVAWHGGQQALADQ
jgi:hypothetical protein